MIGKTNKNKIGAMNSTHNNLHWRYRLVEKIGYGGQGDVYLAEDALSGKKVILKISEKTCISSLKNEYIRLHRLNHCGLPRVFDFYYTAQGAILSMEYCVGESLREIIPKKEIDISKALWIWNNITEIVSYIHNHHLVHGDIKPDNLILNKNDIKLLDLGMARRSSSQTNNLFIGTAAYAAPEILSGKGDVSQAADIYSLGIIVYEMLVGNIPKTEQRLNRDEPWIIPVQKKLPGAAAEILVKMLRYNPQERFPSADILKSAMRETGLFPELPDRRQFKYVPCQTELLGIDHCNMLSTPLMINGPEGSGKTRLLKERNFINQLNGRSSYYIDGNEIKFLGKIPGFMEAGSNILLDNATEESLELVKAQGNTNNIKIVFAPLNRMLSHWQIYPNKSNLNGFSESEYQKLLKLFFVGISSYDLHLLSNWLLQKAGNNLKYARELLKHLMGKEHIVSKSNIWHIKWDRILNEQDLPEEIAKDLEQWWQLLSPDEKNQAIKASMGCLTKEYVVGPNIKEKLKANGDLQIMSANLTLGFVLGKWNEINIEEFVSLLNRHDFIWPKFYYCQEISALLAKLKIWDSWLILTMELFKKAEGSNNIVASLYFAELLLKSEKLAEPNCNIIATRIADIYCQFGQWAAAQQIWADMEEVLGDTWKYWRKMFYILLKAKNYKRISQLTLEILNLKQNVAKDIKALAEIMNGYIMSSNDNFKFGCSLINDCLESGKATASNNIIMAGYEIMAQLCYDKNELKDAICYFEKAYTYISNDTETYELIKLHASYGIALWKLSLYEKAEEVFLRGINLLDKDTPNQGLANMHYALGLLYFNMKKWQNAEKCFENCIYHSLGIKDVVYLSMAKGGLANVAMKQGRFKWARQIYQELLADCQIQNDVGGEIGCYSNLGVLENLLGNKIKAKEYINLALGKNINNPKAYNVADTHKAKAGIELEQRDWEKSRQSFYEYLKYCLDKSIAVDAEAYIDLSYIEYKNGDIAESLKMLEKAKGLPNKSTRTISQIKAIEGLMIMKKEQSKEGVKKAVEAGEKMMDDGDPFYAANSWLHTGEEVVITEDTVAVREVMPWLLKAESEFMQMGTPEYLERVRQTIARAARILFQRSRKTVSSDLLKGLYKLAELLSLEGDQKTIAQAALNLAVEMSGAERGALFLLDEKSRIELAAQIDIDDQTYQDAMEFSASAVLSTADSGNAIISNDASIDDAFKLRLSVQRNIIRSLLCSPIRFREGTVGAIYLDSKVTSGLFGQEEKDFVLALSGIIGAVLESKKLMNKLKDKKSINLERLDEFSFSLIGQSPAMQSMVERIKAIAKADINVLLDGESGSGKEVVAQVIHEFSPRRTEKFLALDCGSLPETLLESELFGYVKGSFTGANKDKVGLFESANEGTVFLDEIASASQAVQARLLRVLENGEIRRVGDSENRPVDVRVVCATNKDLEIEINEGRFREDLYYRLKVVTIPIPPLRERGSDILLLAEYFKEKYQKKFGKIGLKFNPEAKFQMTHYSWPGNVRELENTVQRAVLLVNKKNIGPNDLEIALDFVSNNHKKEIDQKQQILEALKNYKNNITHVAKAVGLSRRHLYRLIKKYNIQV